METNAMAWATPSFEITTPVPDRGCVRDAPALWSAARSKALAACPVKGGNSGVGQADIGFSSAGSRLVPWQ
jgi:hypothetical protein